MDKDDSFFKRAFITGTKGYLDVFPERELWKQISVEYKGEFRISFNSGNEIEIHRLHIPYKKWNLKISESDTKPLKFEIEFGSQFDYELTIGWEDSIEKLLKLLGKREIEIGNKSFDEHYLINSNDREITLKFFSTEIIDCLLKYNVYSISYFTDIKKQTSNLISVISRTIDDKKTIEDLINLHFKIIDKLEELMIIK